MIARLQRMSAHLSAEAAPAAPLYPTFEPNVVAADQIARHRQAQAVTPLTADQTIEQLAWRDQRIQQLEQALAQGLPAYRVSVATMRESCGESYLVCLDHPSRPLDASPFEPGRITPVRRPVREEAEFEAAEWSLFLNPLTPLTQL